MVTLESAAQRLCHRLRELEKEGSLPVWLLFEGELSSLERCLRPKDPEPEDVPDLNHPEC